MKHNSEMSAGTKADSSTTDDGHVVSSPNAAKPHVSGSLFCQYCNGTGYMVVHIPDEGIIMEERVCTFCNPSYNDR